MQGETGKARAFAIAAHGEQKYGGHPYSFHLDAVAKLAEPYGAEAQVVAYLHDVAEDTSTSLGEIQAEFGDRVAECVALVTDSPGKDRAARKLLTNAKLAKVQGSNCIALIVKAADRLANLRMSAAGGGKLEMYRAEHTTFKAAAYRVGLCDELWEEIGKIFGQVE